MSTPHYFSEGPASEAQVRERTVRLRDRQYGVVTSSGVFSADRLDKGTQVLLAHVPDPPEQGTFLDLGCGWGPLAVVMGLESPGASVWAVDVNTRALDLTERNAGANGAANVSAMDAGEALERARSEGVRFDAIWSNPPVRVGKEAMRRMLSDWLSLLAPGSAAYLVVQRNLGADSLVAWLVSQGMAARRYASKKGYRIIEVTA